MSFCQRQPALQVFVRGENFHQQAIGKGDVPSVAGERDTSYGCTVVRGSRSEGVSVDGLSINQNRAQTFEFRDAAPLLEGFFVNDIGHFRKIAVVISFQHVD